MPASPTPVGGDGATGRRWRANPVPPVPPGRQRTSQRVTRWACPPPHPGYDFPGCSVGRTRYRPRSHRASLLISHASNRPGSFSLPVGLPCVPAMGKAWRTFVQVGKSIRKLSPTNLHHCRADKARCTESSCPTCETTPSPDGPSGPPGFAQRAHTARLHAWADPPTGKHRPAGCR